MTARSLRRVAFVALRFHELRGLIPATFGAGLVLSSFLHYQDGAVYRRTSSMLMAVLIANSLHGFAHPHLERGYRTAFGTAVATRRQRLASGLLIVVVAAAGMLDALGPELGAATIAPLMMPLTFVGYSLWIVARDWPWRIHYAAASLAGAAAAGVVALAPPAGHVEAWMAANALVGLALLGAGLCDHHLLAVSMRPGSPHPRPPLPIRRRLERVLVAFLLIASGAFMTAEPGAIADGLLFPMVLGLVLAVGVLVAIPAAVRGALEFNEHARVTLPAGPRVDLGADILAGIFAVAAAAALESVVRVPGLMIFTAAAAAALTGRRDPAMRVPGAVIAIVLVAFGVLGRQAGPPRALGLLVSAAGVGVLIHASVAGLKRCADADSSA